MTVTVTDPISAGYTPNGATTSFGFDFKIADISEIEVRQVLAGVTAVIPPADYTVTIAVDEEGGTVVFDVAPAAGTGTIYLVSNPAFTQQSDFGAEGPFSPQTLNNLNDRSVIRDLYLRAILGRAILVPFGDLAPAYADFIDGLVGPTGAPGSGNLIGYSADDYLTPNSSSTPDVAANNAGMVALAAAVQASDGGVVDCTPGATYWVGGQTFQDGAIAGYTGNPVQLFAVTALTKLLHIRGNGAKIKCASGFKYGTYDSAGVSQSPALPYTGTNRATPYKYMFDIQNCTGPIRFDDLELDGNILGQTVGGQWGDTGWQIPMTGILLTENSGGITLNRVNAHHHGQDGVTVDGVALDDAAVFENIVTNNCNFDTNGRLGVAVVGGRGITFNGGSMNWNSASDAPGGGLTVTSNPGAGCDLEAEAGKAIRDVVFNDVEMVGNRSTAIIADNTDVARVTVNNCTLIQTHASAYVLWPNVPHFHINGGLVVGTVVNARGTAANPEEAFLAKGTIFSNDAAESPTGVVGCVNNIWFETSGVSSRIEDCTLIHNRAAANNASDIGFAHNCTFVALAGNVTIGAIFSGRTEFIMQGGFVDAFNYSPGGLAAPQFAAYGNALDSWKWTIAGVTTVYPATIDRATGDMLGTTTRGDVAATLTPAADKRTQVWSTAALTVDRAVTLATATAKVGSKFKVIRTSAGAFNLNVGTGPLKALAANTWAEVEYDGTAWFLAAYGAL